MTSTPGVPTTMLAWRKYRGVFKAIREEVPVPSAPANGFLIKVLAAGVCHSDHLLIEDDSTAKREKYTLGHEGCGKIIEIGREIQDPRFKLGDIIAIVSVPGCGEESCPECSSGQPQICCHCECPGITADGSFAPYVAVSYRAAVAVPSGVTPAQAAVATDAMMTAYNAVMSVAGVRKADTVLIYGIGGLGFNALQIALRHVGANVLVVDRREETLRAAEDFGARKENIVPVGADVVEFVKERKIVVDVVIDFVGARETFRNAQELVRTAGKIVVVGLMETDLPVASQTCCRKKLNILFGFGGVAEDVAECLKLIANGTLQPQVELGDLDDFPDVLERLHAGKIKSRIALIPKQQ